jgi:SAM-dependent methyltransferase
MAELTPDDVREKVRERYAAAATATSRGGGCCSGSDVSVTDERGSQVFGDRLYGAEQTEGAPDDAPTSSSASGASGPSGRAIGLDMTDEMLALARANAQQAGATNVDWLKGHIEDIPLPDASVDVVISNCVINLSADKSQVLREVARVLRAGGRFAVSDVIADPGMDEATRADMQQWTGCIAGALTREEFAPTRADAGLADVEIRETHRVHAHAASAIVRATKPRQ